MAMKLQDVRLNSVIDEAISVSESLIKQKQLQLIREYKSDEIIKIDAIKMKQVFINLISNAVKFTENGHIKIFTESFDDYILCGVEDTGIGIEEKYYNMIFDRFQQIESSNSRKKGGTGLGLALCKNFIELHKGRIYVKSQANLGSTFYVEIPKSITDNAVKQIENSTYDI